MTDNYPVLRGIILRAEPIGEYDRRIVILTLEMGKVSAFVRGARKPNNKFCGLSMPMCYGSFVVYSGRNSISIREIEIENYFDKIKSNLERVSLGMYFLEMADYCSMENNDEKKQLSLLYVSLMALSREEADSRLIRAVYEIRTMANQGEFGGIESNNSILKDTILALNHIVKADFKRLFSFQVSEEVLLELEKTAKKLMYGFGGNFKSLEML